MRDGPGLPYFTSETLYHFRMPRHVCTYRLEGYAFLQLAVPSLPNLSHSAAGNESKNFETVEDHVVYLERAISFQFQAGTFYRERGCRVVRNFHLSSCKKRLLEETTHLITCRK